MLKVRKKSRYSDGMTRADTLLLSSQRVRYRANTAPTSHGGTNTKPPHSSGIIMMIIGGKGRHAFDGEGSKFDGVYYNS